MSPWIARAVVLAGAVVMVVIRAPHGHRSRTVKVVRHRKGPLEKGLLAVAWIGFFVPLIWVVSPLFSFADYPLRPAPFAAGIVLLALGLWLLWRSHADLGRHWSVTLEVRENHSLVTSGVYRSIRHPMYASLWLFSLGQLLVLPNWIAGPAYLVAFGLLFALRLHAEERMMHDEFGPAWTAYAERTKRIIPGIW